MKLKNKLLLSTGTIAATIMPIIAVVSCSNQKNESGYSKVYKNLVSPENIATPAEVDSTYRETWSQYFKDQTQFNNPFPSGYALEYKIKYTLHKNEDNLNDVFFVLKPISLEIVNHETYISTLESILMQANRHVDQQRAYDYLKDADRHKFIRALLAGSKTSFASDFQRFFETVVRDNETFGTRVEWSKASGDEIDKFIDPIVNNYVALHPLVR